MTKLVRLLPITLLSVQVILQVIISPLPTTTVPNGTKLVRMVTIQEPLLLIMLLYPLVTWSCEITWQTKIITSPLPRYLRPPNLALVWRIICIHYYNAFGYQTWQDGDKQWRIFFHKLTQTCCIARSRELLDMLHLYHKKAYTYQTW